jgi:hypothetical protein
MNNIFYKYILILIYIFYFSSDYFPAVLSVETWIATYDTMISIVNTENFKFNNNNKCNSPQTRYTRRRSNFFIIIYKIIKKLRDTKLEIKEIINKNGLVIRPKTYYKTYYKIYSEIEYNTRTYY